MSRIRLHLEIAAAPAVVGAFFLPHRMAGWYGRELDSRFEIERGADEFCVGQKVRICGRLAGREVALVAVVTAYQRGRLLEWRFQDRYGVSGRQRWEILPSGGGCRVEMEDEFQFPGRLGRLWEVLVMRHAVRARDRRDLERLKRMVEHGAPLPRALAGAVR
jgi:hypothetical protein